FLTSDDPKGRAAAIVGPAGNGKTWLTAAVAATSEVQAAFPDGTLWASLGQQPDARGLLDSWGQYLGLDRSSFTGLDATRERMDTELRDKRMLLVLDDAWDASAVNLLPKGGPRCRILITSRDSE